MFNKSCTETKNAYFIFDNFENCSSFEICWSRRGQRRQCGACAFHDG